MQGSQHIKEEMEKVKLEMEAAKRKGDWQKVSELQYGRLPQLEAQLNAEDRQGDAGRGAQAEAVAHTGGRGRNRRGGVARHWHSRLQNDAGRA